MPVRELQPGDRLRPDDYFYDPLRDGVRRTALDVGAVGVIVQEGARVVWFRISDSHSEKPPA